MESGMIASVTSIVEEILPAFHHLSNHHRVPVTCALPFDKSDHLTSTMPINPPRVSLLYKEEKKNAYTIK